MNTALASLGKNIILIALVVVSVLNFFYGWLSFKDLLGIQIFAGLAYVFLSCYEYLNAHYQAQVPVERYSYFPYRFFMFGIFKIGAYILFAIMLWTAGSRIQYLYPICLLVAITEVVVMLLRYKKRLCFVCLYANYLYVSQSRLFKVFANELREVEFRHNILYFIKKDNTTFLVKLDEVEHSEKFKSSIQEWINRNGVALSAEAKSKWNA
jgi:hypothetical protein